MAGRRIGSFRNILHLRLTLARCLGLFPCNSKLVESRSWARWSRLLTLLAFGKCVYVWLYNFLLNDRRHIHKYLIASEVFSSLEILSCLLLSQRAAPAVSRLLQALADVEGVLADQGIPINYRSRHLALDFFLRASALSLICSLRLMYSNHLVSRVLELSNMIVLTSAELLNLAVLSAVKQALRHLNLHLNKGNLPLVLSLEHILLEVSKSYKDVSGGRLLLRIGTTYVISTIELFFILTVIGVWEAPYIIYQAVVTPYNLYEIFTTVFSISSFSKETGEMRKTLYGLVLSDDTGKLSYDGKVRARLRMKNSIVFSACGFFPIDATLVHSILASIANYLTIIYQFGIEKSTQPLVNVQQTNSTG